MQRDTSQRRVRRAVTVAVACHLLGLSTRIVQAQEATWNDPRTMQIVERAVERRSRRFADSGLTDYRAEAHGYLTFLAQFGKGFREPPKIVRIDQLAVEVLWRAPTLSKQRLIGQRDTLLLPAEISYYRDRFGVVQNNFPDLIRMGDGRDVRDVPHPLSRSGLQIYEYAIRDSLVLVSPTRTLNVYEIHVRPRDDGLAAVVGAVYLDRETGAVARMALTFTSHALLDKRIETLSVILENVLIDRFWLPSHQEIEVVRQSTWLDFPARGIIRARWEICCYDLNVGLTPNQFEGFEFVHAPPAELERYRWEGGIVDSLPGDISLATEDDARRVIRRAQEMVGVDALSRQLRGGALSVGRVSDFLRVNRVEGVAVGAGATWRFGSGTSVDAIGRYGFADESFKGRLSINTRPVSRIGFSVYAEHLHRDAGDVMETSLIRNTLTAGAFGRDYTNPYEVRGIGAVVNAARGGTLLDLTGSYERHERVSVNMSPLTGEFAPTIPAWSVRMGRLSLRATRPPVPGLWDMDVGWAAELRGGLFVGHDTTFAEASPWFGRAFLRVTMERSFGAHRLLLATTAGGATAAPDVPPQEYVLLGGPRSAPGYGYHELTGTVGATQHAEWHLPVPFPSIGLGRYGRTPPSATLAPFAHMAFVRNPAPFAVPRSGFYPSVGIAAQLFYDLFRIQTARGLRDGRWTLSIDLNQFFWGIL
ncbi:MAG: hypothetical protein O7I93_18080 [Gemmatimonadetes bacterium]|nr:hypothetical protein [Gemmatimonadota bacterium]